MSLPEKISLSPHPSGHGYMILTDLGEPSFAAAQEIVRRYNAFPEMLDALRLVIQSIHENGKDDGKGYCTIDTLVWCDVEAAIAKATGKEGGEG